MQLGSSERIANRAEGGAGRPASGGALGFGAVGAFLQRNAWILPLGFALLFGLVGALAYRELYASATQQIASRLEGVRDASMAALHTWARNKREQAEVHAADPRVAEYTQELLQVLRGAEDPRQALLASPAQGLLRERLRPAVEKYGFPTFASVAPSGIYLAAAQDVAVGAQSSAVSELLPRILAGETILTRPIEPERLGPAAAGQAMMLVGAPLRNEDGKAIAVFGFSIRPADDFVPLLSMARSGESGETYTFDKQGRLLSPSRFEEQLRKLGVIAAGESSEMNVQIRDPGGNLAEGFEPSLPLEARPFTRAAAGALSGGAGVDVEGYPDYRGVPVIGAWAWIPELEIGIASEIDRDEAYAPLTTLRATFGAVMGLLALAALGMFLYSFLTLRLRRQMDEARQLGRYRIESRIGRGGMGTVYRARHALLRRPTAVKVLNTDRSGKEGVARFEREVQITSSLRHPNTIEIYDYGYTPDGTFYYAMEYLQGIDIGDCVQNGGPQPEARVLHVMRQACGSIAEAHAAGLIHRDIKPANIMLCERGGLLDFVKVLDFGLVRQQQQAQDAALTDVHSLTGTPLYMPPEVVRNPEALDARGDVYQLGLVAYYLLTGSHLFTADNPMDVMLKHVSEAPVPPSQVLGQPVSDDLEQLILRCLAKDPAERPADAGLLLECFERCSVKGTWGQAEARAWWTAWNASEHAEPTREPSSTGSMPTGIDLAQRTRST